MEGYEVIVNCNICGEKPGWFQNGYATCTCCGERVHSYRYSVGEEKAADEDPFENDPWWQEFRKHLEEGKRLLGEAARIREQVDECTVLSYDLPTIGKVPFMVLVGVGPEPILYFLKREGIEDVEAEKTTFADLRVIPFGPEVIDRIKKFVYQLAEP